MQSEKYGLIFPMSIKPEFLLIAIGITSALVLFTFLLLFFFLARKVKKLISAAFFLLFLTVLAASFYISEKPFFCQTCHEIKPYYEAWRYSPHQDTNCLSCHSKKGVLSKIKVKYRGLKNLYTHWRKEEFLFETSVSEEICSSCHSKDKKFCPYTERKDCLTCHKKVGHPSSQ